jgi:hypothetical protein
MDLRIAQFDHDFEESFADEDDRIDWLDDKSNYSLVPFKMKLNPKNGHAIPFVTNHRYHIHWNTGLDFTQMKLEVSERWTPQDHDLHFVTNYTDYREAIAITTNYDSKGEPIPV